MRHRLRPIARVRPAPLERLLTPMLTDIIVSCSGGMIAPLMGGMLLMIDRSFPVYTSAGVFVLAGACVLMLQEDAGDGKRSAGGGGAVMH